jgi:hypothetical protein
MLGLTQIGAEDQEHRLQEWKLHDRHLSVAVRQNQPGHGSDVSDRRECGRCRGGAQGQGRLI